MTSLSPAMRVVLARLQLLSSTDRSIMLVGQSGTGKSRLAQAVHISSARTSGPLIVLDVSTPPLSGAIDSAQTRTQYFLDAVTRARCGTLVIDGVAGLPLDQQEPLLSALAAACGPADRARTEPHACPRLVTNSLRELEADVLAGRFRRDLYFRLAGAVVTLPMLGERIDDLAQLVRELLDEFGWFEVSVSSAALELLKGLERPGNIRELKQVLAQASISLEEKILEPHHLPTLELATIADRLQRLPLAGVPLAALERVTIAQTLAQFRGNKVHTARALQIAVSTLYEKLKRYGL